MGPLLESFHKVYVDQTITLYTVNIYIYIYIYIILFVNSSSVKLRVKTHKKPQKKLERFPCHLNLRQFPGERRKFSFFSWKKYPKHCESEMSVCLPQSALPIPQCEVVAARWLRSQELHLPGSFVSSCGHLTSSHQWNGIGSDPSFVTLKPVIWALKM